MAIPHTSVRLFSIPDDALAQSSRKQSALRLASDQRKIGFDRKFYASSSRNRELFCRQSFSAIIEDIIASLSCFLFRPKRTECFWSKTSQYFLSHSHDRFQDKPLWQYHYISFLKQKCDGHDVVSFQVGCSLVPRDILVRSPPCLSFFGTYKRLSISWNQLANTNCDCVQIHVLFSAKLSLIICFVTISIS